MDMYSTIKSMPERLELIEEVMSKGILILSNGEIVKINHSQNINIKKEKQNGFVLIASICSKKEPSPLIGQFEDILILYRKLMSYGLHIKNDKFKINDNFLEIVYRCFRNEFNYSVGTYEFIFVIDYFIPRYTGRIYNIYYIEINKNIICYEYKCPELLLERLKGQNYKYYYDYGNDRDKGYISNEYSWILCVSKYGFSDFINKKDCTYLSILENQIKEKKL